MVTTSRDADAEIIKRSMTAPESFAEIFDQYYVEIHGYAARRVGADLADDLASEAFLVAFAQRGRYDQAYRDARPWLYGIASNLIRRHHQAEQRRYRALARSRVDDVQDGHADLAAARLDAQAYRRSLAAALATISARDREVLLLVAWADMTSDEVGRALGIPAGTVRSRLHRARQQIRSHLEMSTSDDENSRRTR